MKLHLPKVLFTAVIAAAACVQQAYAEDWNNDGDTGYYYRINEGSDSNYTETLNAYKRNGKDGEDLAVRDQYQIKAGQTKTDKQEIGTLTIVDGKLTRIMWNWQPSGTGTSLTAEIGTMNIGQDGAGSGHLIVDGGNVITIGKVNGTLKSLKNGGSLTIGTNAAGDVAASTTTIGSTLYNNGPTKGGGIDNTGSTGTLTLNGNIAISADESFTGFVLDATRGVGYSETDGNGYRTITNAHYYLVQGGTSTVTSTTATLGDKTVDLIKDAAGVVFASGAGAGEEDRSWYYVNTEVTYGGEGGVNDAPGFALNGGTLTLNSAVDSSMVTGGIKATSGTTSTLNLANNVTIGTNAVTMEAGATVNLKGSGTVAITEGTSVGLNSVLPYTCAEGWTGTVDFTNCTAEGMNFAHYGVAGSTIRLNGVTGWFFQGFTSAANVLLEGDGMVINGSSSSTNRFNGKVSGAGDIIYSGALTSGYTWRTYFSGDTSEWSGNIEINGSSEGATNAVAVVELRFDGGGQIFDADGNSAITNNRVASYTQEVEQEVNGATQTVQQTVNIGAVNVYIGKSGETSYMNAAINNANTGTLNVTATNNTVFNKAIDVSSLTVNDGATATLKADSSTGTVTVNGSGALEFDGGTLTVSSALTLDASAIRIAESLTQDTTIKTLITMSGEESTLTVNNVDSWTGSTYIIDGTRYTTSLNNTGSVLQLEFDQVFTLDLEVATAQLANGVLTLNVNEDLTGITGVDLTLSDAALAVIDGQFGSVTLDLVGLNNTGDSVTSISFYDGAYVGEGNGTYRVEYIPEPTTATLSLLALAGLAARRRRR